MEVLTVNVNSEDFPLFYGYAEMVSLLLSIRESAFLPVLLLSSDGD